MMRHLRTISIKARLVIGFAVLFALVIANGAFGIWGMSNLSARLEVMYSQNTAPINNVSIISRNMLRTRMEVWRAQMYRDKDDLMMQTLPALHEAREEIESSWKSYYPSGISSDNERRLADSIGARLPEYQRMVEHMVALLLHKQYAAVEEFQTREFGPFFDDLLRDIDANIADNASQAHYSAVEGRRIADWLKIGSVGAVLFGAVLTVFVAILLINLNLKLENQAATDALTGLHNRRQFDAVFQSEFRRARRNNGIFVLCILDIDNFKRYNDRYGHPEGDMVLQKVAQALRTSLKRESDFVFRLGGEEFGLIYEAQDTEAALRVANAARSNIEQLGIAHADNPGGVVTASFGVACVPTRSRPDLKKVYQSADEALYAAKMAGRNRIESVKV